MDIFKYLKEDDELIEKRLDGLLEHYFEWTLDHAFEESKRLLNAIIDHFDRKEALLINNLKAVNGMQALLDEQKQDKDAIHEEINNLVMMHVDEDGYFAELKKIADKIHQHIQFCNQKFYPEMKSHLTKSDMVQISDQLEVSAMRSPI